MNEIKHAGFDPATAVTINGNQVMLGAIDGVLVRVHYSHDYSLEGESWVGGVCIERFECPASGQPIVLDINDDVIVDALEVADQQHLAKQAGYG